MARVRMVLCPGMMGSENYVGGAILWFHRPGWRVVSGLGALRHARVEFLQLVLECFKVYWQQGRQVVAGG